MADADDARATLSSRTLRLIDLAFDRAVEEFKSSEERPQKRRRTVQTDLQELSGGFVLDKQEDTGAGFIPEDGSALNEFNQVDCIPLSLIPRALQLLDLPPDDAEVLDVFASAASGWQASSDQHDDNPETQGEAVSKRDWRAVCAVLLPAALRQQQGSGDEQSQSDFSQTHSTSGECESDKSDPSEEEYFPTKNAGRYRPSLTGRRHKSAGSSDSDSSNAAGSRSPTARQQREIIAAFTLFFPDVARNSRGEVNLKDLTDKHLAIKDIAKAAASVKEKLSAEEIIEMLDFFSSSSSRSNPTITFSDFQRMMITAKLA